MAIHLGGRRRAESKKARQSGFLIEIEQVWAHRCEPPRSEFSSVLDRSPILSDGDYAEVGTLWRCECGKIHEVYVPHADKPGIREWRVVADDAVAQQTELAPSRRDDV